MKINSIHFGGKMLAAAFLVGAVVPGVIYLVSGRLMWGFCAAGGAILLALAVILIIEQRQDNAKTPYYEKNLTAAVSFDPETQYAVIRSSICTGEKVAGFKDKNGTRFVDVMVIRNQGDAERFKKLYGLDSVKIEY